MLHECGQPSNQLSRPSVSVVNWGSLAAAVAFTAYVPSPKLGLNNLSLGDSG